MGSPPLPQFVKSAQSWMKKAHEKAIMKGVFYTLTQHSEEKMGNRKLLIIILNCIMIIIAISSMIMFGIVGYGRPHGPQDVSLYDFTYFYSAGKAWLTGLNPYDHSFNQFFAYPPNSALFCMLLSMTDLETSKALFLILNIFCIAIFGYICIQLYDLTIKGTHIFLFDFKASLLIFLIVGNSFTANILWVGQTSIIFSTALLASYYFYIRSFDIRSGILLAVALIKPQLAFTFLLWLLLEKRWKIFAAVIVTTAVLGIVPIYNRGIIGSISDWISVLNPYLQKVNSVCFWNLFGIKPLLFEYEIKVNSLLVFCFTILSVLLLHYFYMSADKLKILGILNIIGLLLGQVHQYDLIIIATILPYYLKTIIISKTHYKKFIFFCLAFVIVNFPRKILLLSEIRILHHHREIVLILMLILLLIGRYEKSVGPTIASNQLAAIK